MTDHDLWIAIQNRDLKAVADMLQPESGLCTCGKLFEPLTVFHGIGCGYRVQQATTLRARLDLEARDEPRERYSNIDAETGIRKTGPID